MDKYLKSDDFRLIHSDIHFDNIIVDENKNLKLKSGGKLADLAPTMLDLMNLEKPEEMTGISLLDKE